MWDAIDDIYPEEDLSSYLALLLVFTASGCDISRRVREQVERTAVTLPGDKDLRFAFAPSDSHAVLHERYRITELPAAVFLRDGRARERADSIDDVLELAEDLVIRYRK